MNKGIITPVLAWRPEESADIDDDAEKEEFVVDTPWELSEEVTEDETAGMDEALLEEEAKEEFGICCAPRVTKVVRATAEKPLMASTNRARTGRETEPGPRLEVSLIF